MGTVRLSSLMAHSQASKAAFRCGALAAMTPVLALHLHGDPVTSSIVAYRIYGRNLLSDLAVAGFGAAYRPMSVPSAAIFDGDVFVAYRRPTADVR